MVASHDSDGSFPMAIYENVAYMDLAISLLKLPSAA
jgi:hypothetical protein